MVQWRVRCAHLQYPQLELCLLHLPLNLPDALHMQRVRELARELACVLARVLARELLLRAREEVPFGCGFSIALR